MFSGIIINTIIIESFNSTAMRLDDLLNIDNPYFKGMVNQIYPSELQLNKDNTTDTETPFYTLFLSQMNLLLLKFMIRKRDDINFEIENFPFLDSELPLVYTFNLLGLLESAIMSRASTRKLYI